jgi:hypothetical protein
MLLIDFCCCMKWNQVVFQHQSTFIQDSPSMLHGSSMYLHELFLKQITQCIPLQLQQQQLNPLYACLCHVHMQAAAEAASSPSHGGDALNTLITQWGTASKGSGGSGRHAASGK